MPDLKAYQPSFTAGELSPALWARVDLAKYASGLKTALNLFLYPHGGAANRAGLEFVNRTKTSATVSRLIPFEFNTSQSYILEFGDHIARVYRDGGLILSSTSKTITGVTQAAPGVVTSAGHGYSNGQEIAVSGVVGMTRLNDDNWIVRNVTTDTFTLESLDGAALDTSAFPAWTSGGTINAVYEFVTPYGPDDLADLVFVQEADVMYIVHPSYAPRKLGRSAEDNWNITTPTFAPSIAAPTAPTVTITGITKANPAVVTTSAAHGYAVGDSVTIAGVVGMTQVNGNTYTISAVTSTTFTLSGVDSTGFTAYTSGGTAANSKAKVVATTGTGSTSYSYKVAAIASDTNEESLPSAAGTITNDLDTAGNKNTISWAAVTNAGRYVVYKEDNGVFGYIGGTTQTSFIDENITADLSDTPQAGRNPFSAAGDYPRCVTFIDQRLSFAGSLNNPSAIWTSQAVNYENFGVSSPAKQSDAITFRIRARQLNEIRALLPMRGLAAFSSAAEWIVTGTDTTYLTQTIQANPQSYYGAAKVQPIVVGAVILFAQARGGVIRDFSYEFTQDAFVGKDLTILARHLFETKSVKAWAYAQAPYSIVWVVLDDGSLVSLTYLKEHDVWGWTRQQTDGVFEDVAVIAENEEDVPYFIVKRTINGVDRRYIERLHTREFTAIEDAFFVDSGVTYEGDPVSSLYVPHLAGKDVVALVDGNVAKNLTVDATGHVTLRYPGSKIHLGLPYTAALETLDLDLGSLKGMGTVQSRWKAVTNATMRVEKTRGIWTGPAEDKLVEYKQRSTEAWDEAIQAFTGDISISPMWDWTKGGTTWVKQFDPLPMTILSLMPDVTIGG